MDVSLFGYDNYDGACYLPLPSSRKQITAGGLPEAVPSEARQCLVCRMRNDGIDFRHLQTLE
jgi:hypothetical protein